MAVPQRTRYEVLRRDGFTCRYCGAKAPDATLTIDHVTPVSLGGSDKPDNLVAACAACNAGKASTSPDAELVGDVAEDALRWAAAIKEAARREEELTSYEQKYVDYFYDTWSGYTETETGREVPISSNWERTVLNYHRSGLTVAALDDAIATAMRKKGLPLESRYPYFCGVVRNKLQSLTEAAAELIERGEV